MDDALTRYATVVDVDRSGGVVLRRGQYHDVAVTARAVHRFPRTESARAGLPAAAAVLTALAAADLGVAIPRPLVPVDTAAPVGRCHLTTTRVPGRPLPVGRLDRSDRAAVTDELARLLAALRRAGADPGVRAAVPGTVPDRWARFAARVREVLYPLMSAAGRSRAERELAAVTALPVVATALVHGDLGGENLLWVRAGGRPRLAGVVDWDGAVLGDQADDVASLGVTFGWEVAAGALRDVEATPAPVLARARVVAGTFALQEALPAALDGDEQHLCAGLAAYRV